MSRRQRSRRHEGEHPTYTAILEQAMVVLTEEGFDRFNVQQVLDGAQVSRATLYNHFADVDTLIEAALIATFPGRPTSTGQGSQTSLTTHPTAPPSGRRSGRS